MSRWRNCECIAREFGATTRREDYELLVIKSTVDEEVQSNNLSVLPRIQRIYEDRSGRAKWKSRRVAMSVFESESLMVLNGICNKEDVQDE